MAKVDVPGERAFSVPLGVTRATTRITKNKTELRKIGGRRRRGGDVGGGGNRFLSFFTLRSPGTWLALAHKVGTRFFQLSGLQCSCTGCSVERIQQATKCQVLPRVGLQASEHNYGILD